MAVRYQRIAQIAKTRKKEGRLVVRSIDGLPFLLYEGMQAYVVPPLLKSPRLLTTADIEERGGEFVVGFSEVSSLDTAEQLLGRYLLVRADDIDPDMMEDYEPPVTGFQVTDAQFGSLGGVSDMLSNPYQDTLVVEGPYGQVLIPYVEQFVDLVDYDREAIEVSIPRDLLELQNNGSKE